MGISRLYSAYALANASLGAAFKAVQLSPLDADARYSLAFEKERSGDIAGALSAMEQATWLRTNDYFLWLELGRLRDRRSDRLGALKAFSKSVELAPFYFQPRWQRGNLLLRMGQQGEAFADLRIAVKSEPSVLPAVIELAWSAYNGDVATVITAIQPQNIEARIAMAHFLVRRGKAQDAVSLLSAPYEIPDEARGEFISELLSSGNALEAYKVWAKSDTVSGIGLVNNGGFEGDFSSSEAGFGWQANGKDSGPRWARVTNDHFEGSHSLMFEFGNGLATDRPLLRQLLLAERDTHYTLSFAVKTQRYLSETPLLVFVVDPRSKEGAVLGQSMPIQDGSRDWQQYSFSFTTTPETQTLRVTLQAQPCSNSPCKAFGYIWLDDFVLTKN
jgi:hypothetical protein